MQFATELNYQRVQHHYVLHCQAATEYKSVYIYSINLWTPILVWEI